MEIKQGNKIFFPTNDLRQTAEAILSLLNNTVGEDHQPIKVPAYVTREYILEMVASIVNALLMTEKASVERKAFEEQIRRTQ